MRMYKGNSIFKSHLWFDLYVLIFRFFSHFDKILSLF